MTNISFEYIYNLLKLAAKDIPDFYPDWVKKHFLLERYNTLSEINKKIPIQDYREEIKISDILIVTNSLKTKLENSIIALYNEILNMINPILRSISAYTTSDDYQSQLFNAFKKILNQFYYYFNKINLSGFASTLAESILMGNPPKKVLKLNEVIESDSFNFKEANGNIYQKKLKYDTEASINVILKNLIKNVQKFILNEPLVSNQLNNYCKNFYDDPFAVRKFLSLEDISKLYHWEEINKIYSDSGASLQNKEQGGDKLEIVFSKQPSDLLSMSIRDDWTSCQNLMRNEDMYNASAIYSAASPHCGIIYITNKNDWEGRGERMIARSLVLHVLDVKANSEFVAISNLYSNAQNDEFKDSILEKFRESLQGHCSLPVFILNHQNASSFYIPYTEWYNYDPVTPYLDYGIGKRYMEEGKEPGLIEFPEFPEEGDEGDDEGGDEENNEEKDEDKGEESDWGYDEDYNYIKI